jgi:hypothetical protein
MQKWEYLFVVAEHGRHNWHPRRVNGQELRDWEKGPTISEYANQLGMEGWELVSNYCYDKAGKATNRFAFKRPLEAA